MLRRRHFITGLALLSALTACSSGDNAGAKGEKRPAGPAATIRVPADAPTIQQAVDRARTGDLVLVSPGTYRESVHVSTPGITVRGTDRTSVVLDGDVMRSDGIVVTASGVTVQNLTVRNYVQNGVLVTGQLEGAGDHGHDHATADGEDYIPLDPAKYPPVQGFRVDHVTAYNNGLYGIYAFDAQHGLIEASYVSGSADSGIYVGQCKPCDVVVRGNVAERNAVGFEDANAGGELFVIGNRFVGNRVGATVTTDHQEAFVPQAGAVIAGNLIAANNQVDTPSQADGGFGVGFGVAGGTENLVLRNRIESNARVGMLLTSADDIAPAHNEFRSNVVAGPSGSVDFVYAATVRSPGVSNCLHGNTLRTANPPGILTTLACPGDTRPREGVVFKPADAPPGIAFSDVEAPPTLPSLPDAAKLPAANTDGLPGKVDLDSVQVPSVDFLANLSAITW